MENIYDLLRLDSVRNLSVSSEINEFFRNSLYNSNGGRDLDIAGRVAGQNSWIFRLNCFLSGRDFINYVKMRINALPYRVRITRRVRREATSSVVMAVTSRRQLITRYSNVVGVFAAIIRL